MNDKVKDLIISRLQAGEPSHQIAAVLGISVGSVAAVHAHFTRGTYGKSRNGRRNSPARKIQNVPFAWENSPFPSPSPDVEFVTLPDGTVLPDVAIWYGFMQNELNVNPDRLWRHLQNVPDWPVGNNIPFRPKGDNPHWIPGNHPALHTRGNPLKRAKMWFQNGIYGDGCRTYLYPGKQNRVCLATHDITYCKPLKRVTDALNAGLNIVHNHWIVTRYADENEAIDFHSDKDSTFTKDCYILSLKLGAPRDFAFRLRPNKKGEKTKPFMTRILPAGTAVFIRAKGSVLYGPDGNSIVQHSVPAMKTPCGLSGSIVGRAIASILPWEQVHSKVLGSRYKV